MIDSREVRSLRSWIAFALLGGLMLGASGCETTGSNVLSTAATATPVSTHKVSFSGNVHGGQQPVSGATVTLWAAGTTAASGVYGANATQIAQTTTSTDGNGTFSFDNTSGVSPCTIGQYLYITAQGGSPTGVGSYVNPAAAMLAVIPTPCSSTTGNQFVVINEVTTVAGVWALQQFMSITPTPGVTIPWTPTSGTTLPWQIGAPATNTIGLANAFLISQSLVNLATGATATSTTSNTITNAINSILYTTTVNPDYHKINTLASVLSACVNDGTGTTCSNMAADTNPTPANTALNPTDTIQIAYYLATNPAGLTMNKGTYTTSPAYLCGTYNLPESPFATQLTCTTSFPNDWAILVTYRAYQGASTVGTVYAGSVAIDGSGNIWTALTNTVSSAGSITALNAAGQVILAPVTSGTLSAAAGWNPTSADTFTINDSQGDNSLAIDPLGNVWAASFYDTLITDGSYNESPIVKITPTGLGTTNPTATATGYLAGFDANAIAIDSSDNIYVSSSLAGNTTTDERWFISELTNGGTTAAPAYNSSSSFYTGIGRDAYAYGQIIIDQSGYADPLLSTSSNICRENTTINAAAGVNNTTFCGSGSGVGSSIVLSGTQWVSNGAIDARNNIWGTNGTYLNYINYSSSISAPIVNQYTGQTGTTMGGLYNPAGVAIDGAGNVWVANFVSTAAGGLSEFVPSSNGTVLTALSPAGVTGALVYGFGSSNFAAGPSMPVIDSSGNVWIADKGGSYLYVLVGGAAPVTTPLVAGISKVGTRP